MSVTMIPFEEGEKHLDWMKLCASFEYVSMPMAIMWGVTVFGTWPDGVAWAGIALILGSGLYLVWRESRKGQHVTDGPVRR